MLSLILVGASGAMGQAVLTEIKANPDISLSATVQAEADTSVSYPVFTNLSDLSDWYQTHPQAQTAIIDFSTPALTMDLLDFATAYQLPLVLATTGQNESQKQAIQAASQSIALINTHNTSIGVSVMQKAVTLLSQDLYKLGYDIEIIEKHHRYKQDAPSGTALLLQAAASQPLNETLTETNGRTGVGNQRPHNEIGIHAVRAGNIVGEHTVMFANNQEVIEITHKAGSKALFADGAIKAAQFLVGQAPGLYTMEDVLS